MGISKTITVERSSNYP